MEDESVLLNDGHRMPRVGYGLWQIREGHAAGLVEEAIHAGYRHLDTAQAYFNEQAVGQGIRQAQRPRGGLFVTSKLRGRDMGRVSALRSFKESLDRLKLDYLDLFLIHWPIPALDKYVETWESLVELKESGLVRSIGVSNFGPDHIDRLVQATNVVPVVNQLEVHPAFQQQRVRGYHRQMGIVIQSYSPFGGSGAAILRHPVVVAMAEKHGRTAAQIVLRWHTQQSLVPLPRSSKPVRLAENLAVWDFSLDEEDMCSMRGLDEPYGNTQPFPNDMNEPF